MTLVDVIAPHPPNKQCWVLDEQQYNKFPAHHKQHCFVGGRGGTNTLLYRWSHNFCRDCLKFRKIFEVFMYCFVDYIAWLLLFYLINVHIE